MEFLSFKKTSAQNKTAFQSLYLKQNLQVIEYSSAVLFVLSISLRLVSYFYFNSFQKFTHFQEYNNANWIYLSILPLYWFFARLLSRKLKNNNKKSIGLIHFFGVTYGAFFLVCGMLTSFIAMHNPHNSLTVFLATLILVSMILVYELSEVIVLATVVQLSFYQMLHFYGVTGNDFFSHMIVCFTMLVGFVFLCRYIYLYKANNFEQFLKIEEINAELIRAGAFKNEILGMVAHDLRNPIAAIESITALIQMDNTEEETDENLEMIKASCVKAKEIINDLLDAAREETDEDLVTRTCDVKALLENLVREWKSHSLNNEIKLSTSTQNIIANLNMIKINRVLDNLISNAIKFSEANGLIEVKLTDQGKRFLIEVCDSGIGIPPDLLPFIFERFSKSSRTGLRGEKSVGLGLNISKRIIEKHGGILTVKSTVGRGSTFRIDLPVSRASFNQVVNTPVFPDKNDR